MAIVSMKSLLESGVHFGHQTRRWNPKMKPYIFTERSGIYIIDLQRTLRELDSAYRFIRQVTSQGGTVLFIGTKKQAQEPVAREAERSGQPYVNERWLGGMLTNFATMKLRIKRMKELEQMNEDGSMLQLPKKEQLKLNGQLAKLQKNLTGIRDMDGLPSVVFVIDTKREEIAVAEARRLKIPVVALVDTNADPDEVDYVIPGNDDAIRSVNLMAHVIADAIVEGRAKLEGPQVLGDAEPRQQPKVVADSVIGEAPAAVPAGEPAAEVEPAPAAEPDIQEAPVTAEPAAAEVEAEVASEDTVEAVEEAGAEPAPTE
jgi:small subunit ribosomal protein S2